jgi:hypothetical protein
MRSTLEDLRAFRNLRNLIGELETRDLWPNIDQLLTADLKQSSKLLELSRAARLIERSLMWHRAGLKKLQVVDTDGDCVPADAIYLQLARCSVDQAASQTARACAAGRAARSFGPKLATRMCSNYRRADQKLADVEAWINQVRRGESWALVKRAWRKLWKDDALISLSDLESRVDAVRTAIRELDVLHARVPWFNMAGRASQLPPADFVLFGVRLCWDATLELARRATSPTWRIDPAVACDFLEALCGAEAGLAHRRAAAGVVVLKAAFAVARVGVYFRSAATVAPHDRPLATELYSLASAQESRAFQLLALLARRPFVSAAQLGGVGGGPDGEYRQALRITHTDVGRLHRALKSHLASAQTKHLYPLGHPANARHPIG